MAKKPPPTLADRVEAAERRAAPKAQARVARRGVYWSAWLGVLVLTIVLSAGAVVYLKMNRTL